MSVQQDLYQAIVSEIDVCKHLYTKLTPEAHAFAPTNMRTTLELLQYLSVCAGISAKFIADGDVDAFRAAGAAAKTMPHTDFLAAMDKQKAVVKAAIDSISDADLNKNVTFPWGAVYTRQSALVGTSLKWITAYKMQLFIYAKMNGATTISSSNCWRGVDAPAPAPKA